MRLTTPIAKRRRVPRDWGCSSHPVQRCERWLNIWKTIERMWSLRRAKSTMFSSL